MERENDEVLDALEQEARRELQQIDRALARMDRGEYGTCTECGVEIPIERLRALPYADRCVKCADKGGS